MLALGIALGYGLYRILLQIHFSELALSPGNRLLLYATGTVIYLGAAWQPGLARARPFMLGCFVRITTPSIAIASRSCTSRWPIMSPIR